MSGMRQGFLQNPAILNFLGHVGMRAFGTRLPVNQPFQTERLKITPDFIELLPGIA
jgi:hypothetical protein